MPWHAMAFEAYQYTADFLKKSLRGVGIFQDIYSIFCVTGFCSVQHSQVLGLRIKNRQRDKDIACFVRLREEKEEGRLQDQI